DLRTLQPVSAIHPRTSRARRFDPGRGRAPSGSLRVFANRWHCRGGQQGDCEVLRRPPAIAAPACLRSHHGRASRIPQPMRKNREGQRQQTSETAAESQEERLFDGVPFFQARKPVLGYLTATIRTVYMLNMLTKSRLLAIAVLLLLSVPTALVVVAEEGMWTFD